MAVLNEEGLARVWAHVLSLTNEKVNIEEGKGLSTNDFTNEYKEKLDNLDNSSDSNNDNLLNGSADGSFRTINSSSEDSSYIIGVSAAAIGSETKASGTSAFAEGIKTEAIGRAAHAEGGATQAKGEYSHAEGHATIAAGESQHAEGQYNIEDTAGDYLHIAGNGSATTPSNAYTLDWNGNAWFQGNVFVGGTNQNTDSKLLSTQEYVDGLWESYPDDNDIYSLLLSLGIDYENSENGSISSAPITITPIIATTEDPGSNTAVEYPDGAVIHVYE